jgi:hypothetical protein
MFTVKIQNSDETVVSLFSYKSVLFIGDIKELARQYIMTPEVQEAGEEIPEMPYWGKVCDMSSNDPNDCYWLASGDSLFVTDMAGKTVLMEKYIELVGKGYNVEIETNE